MSTSIKAELCFYSGFKIHPGHGVRYIRTDNKTFILLNSKCESQFLRKRNPRKIAWTQVYRRANKKGSALDSKKKKSRGQRKVIRAIVGATLDVINKKRNMKPEERQEAREAAVREAKQRSAAVAAAKKKAATKVAKVSQPKVKTTASHAGKGR
eukprot:CAMPEP_0184643900 /NCGR_PEP_ID=MMETSP0308-20130426/717_1 /TAXON_ID=38269 /ORGANISM="Gloeochaete witrockiana, Strain SAG 46.84" /LENGTH=153 /DNA_ID=CAMNT_0027072149 /DNA_START=44 /DNA_END=505 /DNA_ORIENTATION=-